MSNLPQNLAKFEIELAKICEKSGRKREEINLIAITKNRSSSEINELLENGISKIGENRLQEFLAKKAEIENCEKHFVGRIQSNKAKEIAQNFDVIESVASLKVAQILNDSIISRDVARNVSTTSYKPLPIFLQVNLSREEQKDGFLEENLPEAVKAVQVKTIHESSLSHLKIQGLMVMGVLDNLEKTREIFAQAKKLNDKFGFENLSMGMSGDWKIAVEEGATHLRIGRRLFE